MHEHRTYQNRLLSSAACTNGRCGQGAIDSEELVTLTLHAKGLVGHRYNYTIGRSGRAIQALIEHDLAPLLRGQDAHDIQGLWKLVW